MHRVMIHPATYDDCRLAVDRAFDLFAPEIAGQRVLIKPNVLRASTPDEGICTHPAILQAVLQRVQGMAPASVVVGDNPGLFSYGANEDGFQQAGLLAAAGDCYLNIGNDAVTVPFNAAYADHLSVSRAVMEADVIISLPKFKTHGLTTLTGAIKNSYGILPGAQKAVLHKKAGNPAAFHEVIVDVFGIRVPDLFIVDAVVGMEGNGPASPDLRRIDRVLASDNAVALDAVIARMMGLDPDLLRFLRLAAARGLGAYNDSAIEIIGELAVLEDFQLPPLGGEAIADNPAIQDVIHSRTVIRPTADPAACTGCETCVDQCPVSALEMVDDLPVVDADTCITCFCCQEICPEKAITLQ